MKRLTITTVFIMLALQFTCGHVSGNKKAECPLVVEEKLNAAIFSLNDQHLQFWSASYRIDSIMNLQTRRRMPVLTRASDPINY